MIVIVIFIQLTRAIHLCGQLTVFRNIEYFRRYMDVVYVNSTGTVVTPASWFYVPETMYFVYLFFLYFVSWTIDIAFSFLAELWTRWSPPIALFDIQASNFSAISHARFITMY